jgi:hypothetical protein
MLAHRVLPRAQHVIEYHVVTSEGRWATLVDADAQPVHLGPGSVVMFPQGDSHTHNRRNWLLRSTWSSSVAGRMRRALSAGFSAVTDCPSIPIIQALPGIIHIADD